MRAASIAEERARSRSGLRCWHYVKEALVAAGVIHSYPKTEYAKDAGHELVSDYGFKKLPVRDPFKAPVGAVLVYGGDRKSTRLNSSHSQISYAVFCLKKKKKYTQRIGRELC